jgi:spore coat protein U-like protein
MNYSRILARNGGLVAAATLAAALAALRPAEAVPGYDGIWSVVIVTNQGICDTSYRYPIRITNGTLGNAGNATVTISGKVGKNGAVTVHVHAGDKTATGTGRLAGKSGGGSWSGGNGACSGVWQAERRG